LKEVDKPLEQAMQTNLTIQGKKGESSIGGSQRGKRYGQRGRGGPYQSKEQGIEGEIENSSN